MKKKLGLMLFVSGLLLFSTTMAINENKKEKIYENVSQSDWESLSNNYWSRAICKEEKEVEVYSGEYRVIWDHFKNSNPKGGLSYYILDAKSMDSGNYILYNTSSDGYNNELVIWNSSVFQNRAGGSKIQPGEIVRHMTTAEEVGGTFKYGPWTLSSPVTDSLDNKKFQKANYRSDGSHPNKPTMSPNWDAEIRIMTLYDEDHNPGSSSDNKVIVECQKMVIRRCGDGILDEEHEECDPEVEPWKSDGTCDPETCKIAPKCNSKYNGKVVTGDLRKANDLCEVGNVTNLVETETNWTWNCDGVGDPVACSATKRKQGTPDIEKTLKDKIPVSHTGQKLDWEVKVTAKGGDITDFEIKDVMPKELEYVSWSYSGQKPNGITVTKEERTETSGDNIVHYWSVDGTLEEGKTLTIIVNTKVVKMPASGDNIINIACVIDDNNVIDCDDDTPPSPEGKPVIQKTLIDKIPVDHTGQQLDWNVKVTAKGGDITDFVISDIVPRELDYKDREIGENGDRLNVTYRDGASHSTGNGAEVHYWDVAGTLKSGHYLTIKVKTEVKEMPDPGENIVNIACVQLSGSDYVDCEPAETGNPKLRIKKRILDGSSLVKNKTVKIGDLITYRIDFGNSGNAAGTIVSIKDFVPKNVEYVSSQIFLSANHSSGTQNGNMNLPTEGWEVKDGVYIDIFGGITLEPGQRGYILLTGRILTGNTDQRHNFACIYDDDDLIACDDAKHDLGYKCEKLGIQPTSIRPSGSTEVKCTTTSSRKANIEIDCGSGATVRYITGSNVSELTGKCSYKKVGTYNVACKVDGELEDQCKGTVKVSNPPTTCFIAGTKVTMADGTVKNIEDVKIGEKVLGEDGSINTVLEYDRPILGDRHLWSINGSEYFVSDEHPFKTTEGWKSFNPEMTKEEIGWDISELKLGDILITESGLEEIRAVDYIDADYSTPLYNLKLDGTHTYHANGYLVHNKPTPKHAVCKEIDEENGHVVCKSTEAPAHFKLECGDGETYYSEDEYERSHEFKKCKSKEGSKCYVKGEDDSSWKTNSECGSKTGYCEDHPDDPVCGLNPRADCLNVNAGNFSIERGEILPFYFNVEREEGAKDLQFKYVRDEKKGSCDDGAVNLYSFLCKYEIKDPDGRVVDSGDGIQCLTKETNYEGKSLIKSWIETQKAYYDIDLENYDPTMRWWPNIKWTNSSQWKIYEGTLGEYQFQLDVYKYDKCVGDERETTEVTKGENEWICQSNFVLTDPYTVQKTPSGNLTASTDTLKKFKQVDGEKVFADYISTITTSDYAPNKKVQDAMNTFINKYEKLAVNVKDKNNTPNMKKVPGKSIYFIKGDYTINPNKDFTTPFTFVQTDPNSTITIKGDSKLNMMILTRGNIKFVGNCTANQQVRGIFYAEGKLLRDGVAKNINPDEGEWCTKGSLYVNGVLIGKNFEDLMRKSRSHLETWFYGDGKSAKSIMNGASVRIEYSPSIFTKSTMPPGAEDFTTALSIYKN